MTDFLTQHHKRGAGGAGAFSATPRCPAHGGLAPSIDSLLCPADRLGSEASFRRGRPVEGERDIPIPKRCFCAREFRRSRWGSVRRCFADQRPPVAMPALTGSLQFRGQDSAWGSLKHGANRHDSVKCFENVRFVLLLDASRHRRVDRVRDRSDPVLWRQPHRDL